MSKTALQILQEARELISDPGRWTQRAFARNSRGKEVGFSDKDACRFSGLGAVYRTSQDDTQRSLAHSLLNRACRRIFWVWQDMPKRTHAQVLAAFDRAIELARAEAQA